MMHNSDSTKKLKDGSIAMGTPFETTGEDIDMDSLEYRLSIPLRNKRQWSTFVRIFGVFMIILGILDLMKPIIYFLERQFGDELTEPHVYDHILGGTELLIVFSIMVCWSISYIIQGILGLRTANDQIKINTMLILIVIFFIFHLAMEIVTLLVAKKNDYVMAILYCKGYDVWLSYEEPYKTLVSNIVFKVLYYFFSFLIHYLYKDATERIIAKLKKLYH